MRFLQDLTLSVTVNAGAAVWAWRQFVCDGVFRMYSPPQPAALGPTPNPEQLTVSTEQKETTETVKPCSPEWLDAGSNSDPTLIFIVHTLLLQAPAKYLL